MRWITGMLLLSIITNVNAAPLEFDESWEATSDPIIMSHFFTRDLALLPLKGEVAEKKKFWAGDYWPLNKGNINYRWFAKKKVGHNLKSPSKEEVLRMTIPELAQLAPSEKYDLFTGNYDYPLKNEVVRIAADPNAQNWEGICHGWSPASMNHEEPTPKLMKNPDGIEIPFGSTDIKALLSYYYAYGFEVPDTHQIGRRCFRGPWRNRERDCHQDLNAGAFHIILSNRMGIEGKGLIADLNRYQEVWNHPITSYESTITGTQRPDRNSAPGTSKVVNVKTIINYVVDQGHDWHPILGTSKQKYKQYVYFYQLDIDHAGTIIGGEWTSKVRPDFLWLKQKPRNFEGILTQLPKLMND